VCEWTGITCDINCRVTALERSNNNLQGTIPWQLSYLSQLETLNLFANMLSGTIPAELGRLSRLKFLELEDNFLVGTIPPALGNLLQLQFIMFQSNSLIGNIPSELGNLNQLQYLFLQRNKLSGTIPAELGRLGQLLYLDLDNNELVGSIPNQLGNMTQLSYLILYSNQLSGSIPPELSRLKQLQFLWVCFNQLTGTLPPELGELSQLMMIYAHGNQLSGTIPPQFGTLSGLMYLYLESNQLSGSIPASVGNISILIDIFLGRNQLTGSIPPEIGNLTQLRSLSLLSNHLFGTIPEQFSRLGSLTFLELSHNQLTGSIPTGLGNLPLTRLALGHNQLVSYIPSDFVGLSQLQYFNVEWNQLSGSFPCHVLQLQQLTYFIIDSNRFSGPISCPSLSSLALSVFAVSRNNFDGSLPASMRLLSNISYADVSHNQFRNIDNLSCQSLRSLDATSNRISGASTFDWLSACPIIRSVSFANNPIRARLPWNWYQDNGMNLFLQNLTDLQSFNCSNCSLLSNLEYSIRCVSAFQSLSQLDLSDNFVQTDSVNWDGQPPLIPGVVWSNEIVSMTPLVVSFRTLQTLILNNNAISGTLAPLPKYISTLKTLSIRGNQRMKTVITDEFANLNVLDLMSTNVNLTVLPSFLSRSYAPSFQLVQNSRCPVLIGASGQKVLVDPSSDYESCHCDDGYQGHGVVCAPCAAGTFRVFSYVNDSGACSTCPMGRFASATGQSSCSSVSPGQFVSADRTHEQVCPSGADCLGGVLYAIDGFWSDGASVYPCSRSRCAKNVVLSSQLGAPLTASWCSANRFGSASSPTAQLGLEAFLLEYRSNSLCATCLPGFVEISGQCIQCDQANSGYLVALFVLSLVYVLAIRMLSQSTSRAPVKILTFYLCVVQEVVPSTVSSSIASVLNIRLDQGSAGVCLVPAASIEMEVVILVAVLVIWADVYLLLCLEYVASKLGLHACIRKRLDAAAADGGVTWEHLSLCYFRTYLNLLAISVSTLTNSAMSLLISQQVGSSTVLVAYPDVSTSSSRYRPYFVLSICLWLLLALHLLLMGVLLSRSRRGSVSGTQSHYLTDAVDVWHLCYKPEAYYAEILSVVRRTVFLLLSRMLTFSVSTADRLQVLGTLLFAMIGVVMFTNPYVDEDDNRFELLLLTNAFILVSYVSSSSSAMLIVPPISVFVAFAGFAWVFLHRLELSRIAAEFCFGSQSHNRQRDTNVEMNQIACSDSSKPASSAETLPSLIDPIVSTAASPAAARAPEIFRNSIFSLDGSNSILPAGFAQSMPQTEKYQSFDS
jgi:Leucine-rich repeat (LRR) protein